MVTRLTVGWKVRQAKRCVEGRLFVKMMAQRYVELTSTTEQISPAGLSIFRVMSRRLDQLAVADMALS